MDTNLSKLRLSPQALAYLEENGIRDCGALVASNQILQKLRALLNPIQLSKLNALIKDFESCQDEIECTGDKVLLNREMAASRHEIVSQLELERQCLEEINCLILEESSTMTEGAKKIVQKSKAAHQARASRLNNILRAKASQNTSDGSEHYAEPTKLPRTLRKSKLSVRFKNVERPKKGTQQYITKVLECI